MERPRSPTQENSDDENSILSANNLNFTTWDDESIADDIAKSSSEEKISIQENPLVKQIQALKIQQSEWQLMTKTVKYDFNTQPFMAIFEAFLRYEDENIDRSFNHLQGKNVIDDMDHMVILHNQLFLILHLKFCYPIQDENDIAPHSIVGKYLLDQIEKHMDKFLILCETKRTDIYSKETKKFYGIDLHQLYTIAQKPMNNIGYQMYFADFFIAIFKLMFLEALDAKNPDPKPDETPQQQ